MVDDRVPWEPACLQSGEVKGARMAPAAAGRSQNGES